ncbi:hypothetical protein [Altererythrobacter lutimaris]|uniref:hypothetical protein n=1 Tax=Altererythrobacter lutimaris TaxID=2743979 RepID=UPI001592C849|nr:hypothetical protein [Altererythrobacter lutimaris]
MKAAFWRFAHKRYHQRQPIGLLEGMFFLWAAFWGLTYLGALYADFWATLPILPGAVFWVGVPLAIGLARRRIRLERAKGPDALYRKRVEAERNQSL